MIVYFWVSPREIWQTTSPWRVRESSLSDWMDLIRQNKNGGVSVGTFVNFVWVTIREKILSDHISAKEEDKQL